MVNVLFQKSINEKLRKNREAAEKRAAERKVAHPRQEPIITYGGAERNIVKAPKLGQNLLSGVGATAITGNTKHVVDPSHRL